MLRKVSNSLYKPLLLAKTVNCVCYDKLNYFISSTAPTGPLWPYISNIFLIRFVCGFINYLLTSFDSISLYYRIFTLRITIEYLHTY